jgi:hypothetical protein
MWPLVIEWRGPDVLHTNHCRTFPLETQHFGRPLGQINHPRIDEWSAVIDTDNKAAAVLQVCDFGVARQWKRCVSRGQHSHIEILTIGCLPPMKSLAIPRGQALLVVTGLFTGGKPPAGDLIGFADEITAATARKRPFAGIVWTALSREWIFALFRGTTGQDQGNSGQNDERVPLQFEHA